MNKQILYDVRIVGNRLSLYNLVDLEVEMIELFREKYSPEADWIEADLKDMVVGYDCHILTPTQAELTFGKRLDLPVLKNGERMASGHEEIQAFLRDIHRLVEDWRKFQSDSCYIDDDGNAC